MNPRPIESGPWKPTIAHVRAGAVALVLVSIAILTGRPDLLVLGTPFAVVAAWSTITAPTVRPTLEARFGSRTLREGDGTVWRGEVGGLDGAEIVTAELPAAPWLETSTAGRTVVRTVTDGRAELTMTVRSTRWGRRLVDPVLVRAVTSWAAFEATARTDHATLTTLPLPAVFDASSPVRPTDGLVGVYRSARSGEGSEFGGIRPFGVGDRIRRINWPRSLRADQLQVNATWADQDTHVAFVIDAGNDFGISGGIDGDASSLDTTVRAAGAIAEHYSRRGDRISFRAFGSVAPCAVPVGAGQAHLRRFLETLARIRSSGSSVADYRGLNGRQWPASGAELTVMLTPLVTREALDRAVSLGRHGLPVVVIDTMPDHIATADDPYTVLAWRIRLLERRREIRRVQQVGVPVVRWLGPGSLDPFLRDVARRSSAPRIRVR
jgi:uncharacterized protein (DUF58 family)